MTTTEAQTMTEAQATDEAILSFTRKMRRLHNAEFNEIWAMISDGAKDALMLAEGRADRIRDQHGIGTLGWPVEDFEDEELADDLSYEEQYGEHS